MKSVVFWRDTEERQQISGIMKSKFDFPNFAVVGGGTLFLLVLFLQQMIRVIALGET